MNFSDEKVYYFTSLYATEQIKDMSVRAKDALKRAFPTLTVGGFIGLTSDDFMRCRNIGRQSLIEILELKKNLTGSISDTPAWDKPTILVYDFADSVDWIMECAKSLYSDFYVEEIPPSDDEDFVREQSRLKLSDRALIGLTGDYEYAINEVATMLRVASSVGSKLIVYYPSSVIRRGSTVIASQLDYVVSMAESLGAVIIRTMEELVQYINSSNIYIQQGE